jgi:hypothetical protein
MLHKILVSESHWPTTSLQDWPDACKLPLCGWLLYLYWSKLLPLPIHYAEIPPCWGQLCYSFLWLKPKNYLSDSLGTNPSGVNILSQRQPFLSDCHLLNQESSPLAPVSSHRSFFRKIEIGVQWESGVILLCRKSKECPENNTGTTNSPS